MSDRENMFDDQDPGRKMSEEEVRTLNPEQLALRRKALAEKLKAPATTNKNLTPTEDHSWLRSTGEIQQANKQKFREERGSTPRQALKDRFTVKRG